MIRVLLTLLLSSSLVANAAPASEPSETHAERAARLFDAGEFDAAAEAFEAAYVDTGDAVFLYGAGISRQEGGDCEAAVSTLERFRQTKPDPRDDEAAAEIIAECRAAAEPEPPPPVLSSPSEPPPTDVLPPKTSKVDRASWALFGSGAGLVIVGGVLYGTAYGVLRPRDRMESEFERDANRSRSLAISGVVVASVGAAVLVAGVARLLSQRRRASRNVAKLR